MSMERDGVEGRAAVSTEASGAASAAVLLMGAAAVRAADTPGSSVAGR